MLRALRQICPYIASCSATNAYDISLTLDWLGGLSSYDFRAPMETAEKALAMIRKSMAWSPSRTETQG